MFVAWRDLRFARGRFALMGAVIVLITLLVGLLSGLTAGLAKDNTSAVTGLSASADHLAFAAPPSGQSASFAGSQLAPRAWHEWAGRPGVRSAEPIAISTLNAASGDRTAAVTEFAVRDGSGPAPEPPGPEGVVLSTGAAKDLGAAAGDTVELSGRRLEVTAVVGEDSYSHTPVVWTALADGRSATVVALATDDGADLAAGDRAAGTRTLSLDGSLAALPSYQAENGSLQLMRGFLFAISALVIGAFFTVWTIQRSGDIAVLKALGASTPYLLRDALGQAVLMLTAGTLLGTGLAAGVGALVPADVPFVLDPLTALAPAAVLVGLGAVGAGLSVRRITAVDPLTALGSAR
ncbi:ABC transporter permease [Streptomyces beijiangensis]|uniref:ABC transporter permease n=1 Tax=Streptomyces beijiangensis TaxID=163361 RepID=A0A939JJS5_9ACTN|nr:ABC transporter permease [Streptomyces beijiangensis]MBO0515072.1 ABC transporter permease [Streptomyces beijiangensis]